MLLPAGEVLILQRVHADQILYVVLKGCALGKQPAACFIGVAIVFICDGEIHLAFKKVISRRNNILHTELKKNNNKSA